MKYPDDSVAMAKKTYADLLATFKDYSANGWRVGNVFDTLIEFVRLYPDVDAGSPKMAEIAMAQWESPNVQNSMCWYDDYGWWGIASEKAFHEEYRSVFGNTQSSFQKLTKSCWDVMHNGKKNTRYKYRGAPNVWDNRDEGSSPGYFSDDKHFAKPRFAGGVWQWEMFKDERKACKALPHDDCECSYTNPADPSLPDVGDKGGPFQCSVMNGLYFVLALKLRETTAFENVSKFLQQWFYEPTDAKRRLLWELDSNSVLVRERVSSYAGPAFPTVEGYEPDKAWCGDQGLILGGLLDYLEFNQKDEYTKSLPVKIMNGVFSSEMSNQQKVVQPYTSALTQDPEDYNSGSGVFWRYLLAGFRQNSTLRNAVLKLYAADRDNNPIYNSGKDAFDGNSAGSGFFKDFNKLSTLTATIEIRKAALA